MGEQVAARFIWGCSSVGRAPALQAGGHEFESHHLHEAMSNALRRKAQHVKIACKCWDLHRSIVRSNVKTQRRCVEQIEDLRVALRMIVNNYSLATYVP